MDLSNYSHGEYLHQARAAHLHLHLRLAHCCRHYPLGEHLKSFVHVSLLKCFKALFVCSSSSLAFSFFCFLSPNLLLVCPLSTDGAQTKLPEDLFSTSFSLQTSLISKSNENVIFCGICFNLCKHTLIFCHMIFQPRSIYKNSLFYHPSICLF